MAILNVEDLGASIECVVFPSTFDKIADLLVEDRALIISGRVDERNDSIQIIVDGAEIVLDDVPDDVAVDRTVGRTVVVQLEDVAWSKLQRLAALFTTFRGDDTVILKFNLGDEAKALRIGPRVDWCEDLERAVSDCVADARMLAPADTGEDVLVQIVPS